MATIPGYRPVDAVLLRAGLATGTLVAPRWPDSEGDGGAESWLMWIERVWKDDRLAEAVAVASPVLAERVDAVLGGSKADPAQLRRMAMSLARYVIRMRGRATPFGLFAGIAPVEITGGAHSRWADAHTAAVDADGVWLASVIARLEAIAELRLRLRVVRNDLMVVRGGRLHVLWQPHATEVATARPHTVSLRYIPPVEAALSVAESPVGVKDLIDRLARTFPDRAAAVDAMIAELLARGVLISNLRPPLTAHGLGHVLSVLQEVMASSLPQCTELVAELIAIDAQLRATGQPGMLGRYRPPVAQRMLHVSDRPAQPLVVDVRLDGTTALPHPVVAEAAGAADALIRLNAAPHGVPGWREYHSRFLDRYGANTVVAVTDLVDATTGLGFPDHFEDHDQRTWPGSTSRDERLLALAQQAVIDGTQEIVLDDDAIAALAGHDTAPTPPAHLDLSVEVRAASTQAIAAGAFDLVVRGIGRTAVATSGRFLRLLRDEDRDRMVDHYRTLPVGVEGAIAVQLSFPPNHPRVENVTRVPRLLPTVLAIGEHRESAADQITLADLAVTADLDRMFLLSMSQRQVVEPVLTCAASWRTMPPLARLLIELPQATSAPVGLFDWGTAGCLPFRPRLRYRRTILTPARWRIPAAALPDRTASAAAWAAAFATLRLRMRLPASVFVGTADRRLRLGADEPMDLALLREHLDKTPDATVLTEAPTAADHGWCDGRAHEVVIPMARTAPPAPAPAVLTRRGPLPVVGRDHGHLPGGPVLSVRLYGHPDSFDSILIEHLPALLAEWEQPPTWWFLPYRDPEPHLRLRVHTADYAAAARRSSTWAARLRRQGLIRDVTLDTYRPEIARYGSGAAMAAAEALFAADSVAAVAQRTTLADTRQAHPDVVTAVSLTDLAAAVTGGRQAGMCWLVDHPDLQAAIADRSLFRQAITLADIAGDSPTLKTLPGGAAIITAWRARARAATTYTASLTEYNAGVTPASVAVSLLHLHHLRACGIDAEAEARTHRLARAIAQAYAARHPTGGRS
ncbi:lantibiotic dehydratase [Phytohabitans rumicis]|uniref:Lantibiotic dehydratase n=1 Tax=Phytohabitans rumicis TaxID=1076125 RepID=A0A6V8LE51_9ACTN|nr:lantibiotic dehydratase [Phytohabitans rumicis]GFJ93248.1 hypothetical protein Prum_068900 [Phytohabitans rumicis]